MSVFSLTKFETISNNFHWIIWTDISDRWYWWGWEQNGQSTYKGGLLLIFIYKAKFWLIWFIWFLRKEIITHPEHLMLTKRNDIALIKVRKTIPFSSNIKPACLQTDVRDEPSDVNLIITGWGIISAKSKLQYSTQNHQQY